MSTPSNKKSRKYKFLLIKSKNVVAKSHKTVNFCYKKSRFIEKTSQLSDKKYHKTVNLCYKTSQCIKKVKKYTFL